MGYSDKYSLVKKAAKIDLDTDSGYVEFLKIAKESGLTKERLEYYTNAYEASGKSGLHALSYRKRMPKTYARQHWEELITIFLLGFLPILPQK